MNNIISILFIAGLLIGCANKEVSETSFYGKEINSKNATPIDSVIKNFSQYKGKNVVMEATVDKVCEKKGCWMTLQGADKTFRVRFKDYGFFVPVTLVGKKVWVSGEVLKKEVSIAQTKHYFKDAGASKEKINAVKNSTFEYWVMADGVKSI